MNKNEFLEILAKKLAPLSAEERENALSYYEEFFDESESEEKAAEVLGSPESVAEQILKESGMIAVIKPEANCQNGTSGKENKENKEKKKADPGYIALVVILLIVSSPFWLGLLAAIFGVLIGIFAVIFAVVFSFLAIGVAGIASGIVVMFSSVSLGLMTLGGGILSFGIFLLLCNPILKYLFKGIGAVIGLIKDLFRRFFGKSKASA